MVFLWMSNSGDSDIERHALLAQWQSWYWAGAYVSWGQDELLNF